jgi:hypothetical protein
MANESYSVYPDALDGYASLPLRKDGVHEIVAADHNRLRDSIIKIEQELGVQPSGTYATVADRLDNIADAKAIIDAHIANTTDAHDASAISVADSDDIFYYTDVENVLEELGLLLPHKPNVLGENIEWVPNSSVPCFVDGYGTKFVYNVSDWSGEAEDNDLKRTQMRAVNGIRGIHVIEVTNATNNGVGVLTYDQSNTTLSWQAPGDPQPGSAVDVSGLSEGEIETIQSYDTTKALRIARTSDTLPTGAREEYLEVYGLEAVTGQFSILSDGIKTTQYITRTATSNTGISRHQFVISGQVFPADQGTLVLQRKRRNDDDFYPIATLDLAANFDNDARRTGQNVYVPTLEDYDTITLFDRVPTYRSYDFVYKDAAGNNIYENFPIDYYHHQIAKYIIPISNSDLVGGQLESPADTTLTENHLKVSAYRLVHYKNGVTDFTGEPNSDNVFSVVDSFADASDGDNTVRFSNVFVDPNPNRPGVERMFLRPQKYTTSGSGGDNATIMYLSGIRYYTGDITNRFNFGVESDDNLFSNTYVTEKTLRFTTNVFNFPNGWGDGYWGAEVDMYEIFDDGYVLFSGTNLPEFDRKGYYIVDETYHDGRQVYVAPNRFSANAFINARFFDPFGPGDGYDAYGYESRNRILVNSYTSPQATDTQEYFLDETYRVGEDEEFMFPTTKDKFTHSDGFHYIGGDGYDGYVLSEWNRAVNLDPDSLQCGARFTTDEFDICGLIYPQDDYTTGIYPDQLSAYDSNLLLSYDGYNDGDKWYNRLFSLGYPISNARLRVVSSGNNPISFEDVAYYNTDRFGKIEIKIPGNDEKSTEWLDIGRLYSGGKYECENGDGALAGSPTGSAGDFTIPFTFGTRNNADSGNMVAVRVTYFGDTASERTASKKVIITMLELLPPDTSEI